MYRLFFALSFVILFTACNSDDDTTSSSDQENPYALSVGNSWEYEVYFYRSIDQEFELKDILVTTEITGTTEINNETYFNFATSSSGTYKCEICEEYLDMGMVRDSVGYLIDAEGVITFSRESQEDYLITEQLWGSIYGVLLPNTEEVTTSAGTFTAIRNERYAFLPDGTPTPSRDRELLAEGVGFVIQSLSQITQPDPFLEMRLKSYSLVQE